MGNTPLTSETARIDFTAAGANYGRGYLISNRKIKSEHASAPQIRDSSLDTYVTMEIANI